MQTFAEGAKMSKGQVSGAAVGDSHRSVQEQVNLSRGLFPTGRGPFRASPERLGQLLMSPTGQLTPVPPAPQYPQGFLSRYCWW
jgi:hypothetical protein